MTQRLDVLNSNQCKDQASADGDDRFAIFVVAFVLLLSTFVIEEKIATKWRQDPWRREGSSEPVAAIAATGELVRGLYI